MRTNHLDDFFEPGQLIQLKDTTQENDSLFNRATLLSS